MRHTGPWHCTYCATADPHALLLPHAHIIHYYLRSQHEPLSFDRPEPLNVVPKDHGIYDPLDGRSQCHVAPAEWRLLGWLEREGYAYDTWAETQLHFGQLDLSEYKILIISAHPECTHIYLPIYLPTYLLSA